MKRHPIRGFLFGLLLGLGVALVLISLSVIPLGVATPWVAIAAGAIVGLLLGLGGPPRRRSKPTT